MINGNIEKCISVTADDGSTVHVPFYTREYVEKNCPNTPYIMMDVLAISAVPHNIQASVRQHEELISLDITYADMDSIDVETFGKKVADEIVNLTRNNQSTTSGIDFYNVNNQGRLMIDPRCEDLIFRWVLSIEALFNDAC